MCIRDREKSIRNEDLLQLMKLQKTLVYFNTSSSFSAVVTSLLICFRYFRNHTAEDMKLIPVENQKTLDVTMEGAEGNRSYALMFVNNDQYTLDVYKRQG